MDAVAARHGIALGHDANRQLVQISHGVKLHLGDNDGLNQEANGSLLRADGWFAVIGNDDHLRARRRAILPRHVDVVGGRVRCSYKAHSQRCK